MTLSAWLGRCVALNAPIVYGGIITFSFLYFFKYFFPLEITMPL